jgi:hypothetical protein
MQRALRPDAPKGARFCQQALFMQAFAAHVEHAKQLPLAGECYLGTFVWFRT